MQRLRSDRVEAFLKLMASKRPPAKPPGSSPPPIRATERKETTRRIKKDAGTETGNSRSEKDREKKK